jgi:acyl carrier protein
MPQQFTDVEIRINKIVHECFGVEVDNIHTEFRELDIDSLDVAELIMAWEEAFGIEITDDEAEYITNMERAYKVLTSKIQN